MNKKSGAGERRVEGFRQRERAAIDKLVADVEAREAQAAEDRESAADPYRQAEEIARSLYRGR